MSKEMTRVLNFLTGAGTYATTTLRNKDADEVMMQTGGSIISRGVLYNILCKKISPGVCKLSLKNAYDASYK